MTELIMRQESYSYTFDPSNFEINFVVSALFPNGTMIGWEALQRYFQQNYFYINSLGTVQSLGFQKCLIENHRIFLEEDSSDLTPNFTSSWSVCLTKKLKMGLFTDFERNVVNQSVISFVISKCENSTKNNNSCASDEEIEEILKFTQVQATIPKSVYDFNNPINPRKRTFDYQFYHLDLGLMKYFTGQITPIYLKTDHGIVSEEYLLDSVDFNLENLLYETMLRKNEKDMFKYDVYFGFVQQTFYRKNQKIYVFMANFGGIVNILLLLGKLIKNLYNKSVMKHELINIAFKNENLRHFQEG